MAGKKNVKPVEQKVEAPEQVIQTPTVKKPNVFTKSQLVNSAKYRDRRDLVDALLNNNEKYTIEQVDKTIENYMKGKVK